jgi:hypothetical protein
MITHPDKDFQFNLNVDHSDHVLFDLKKIFGIPDSKLTISKVENFNNDTVIDTSDNGKILSHYVKPNFLHIKNKQYKINNINWNKKKCIALACYHTNLHLETFDYRNSNWPHYRYWPIEIYKEIFALIAQAGYQVVTLDDISISLEDKIYWLNENCALVIGYEGGMCHLAHTLSIPTIVLPWSGRESDPKSFVEQHSCHIDVRTYILHDIQEILNWSSDELKQKIKLLRRHEGNNLFLKYPVSFSQEFDYYDIDIENKKYRLLTGLTEFEKDFYKKKCLIFS